MGDGGRHETRETAGKRHKKDKGDRRRRETETGYRGKVTGEKTGDRGRERQQTVEGRARR